MYTMETLLVTDIFAHCSTEKRLLFCGWSVHCFALFLHRHRVEKESPKQLSGVLERLNCSTGLFAVVQRLLVRTTCFCLGPFSAAASQRPFFLEGGFRAEEVEIAPLQQKAKLKQGPGAKEKKKRDTTRK